MSQIRISPIGIKVIADLTRWALFRIALCSLLVSLALPLLAAIKDSANSFSLSYIKNDAGLPQNSVRAILVDQEGFLWVGTENGLSRFDGEKFINFSELNPDIPEAVVLGLKLDSQNRIWSSWYGHSPRFLAGNRTDVIVLNPVEGKPNDLARDSIDLVELKNGDIWISGAENIYRLSVDNKITSHSIPLPVIGSGVAVGKSVVFGTYAGLLVLDTETDEINLINVLRSTTNPKSQENRTSMVTEYNGNVLYCHSKGVYSYSLKTGQLTEIFGTPNQRTSSCKRLGTILLISLTEATSKQYKIVTLDLGSRKIIPNKAGLPASVHKLNSNGIKGSLVDNDKNHWLLAGDTLLLSQGSVSEYQLIDLPIKPFNPEAAFVQTNAGAVWVKTDGNGLAKFSRLSRRFQTILPPADITESSRIRSITVDNKNNVWLVSNEHKLLYWDRSQDIWVDRLPGNTSTIRNIIILPNGTVWVLIPDIGKIIGFDPGSNTWDYEIKIKQVSAAFSQTQDGHLLVATTRAVFKVNPLDDQIEKLADIPAGSQVRAFEYDSSGNLWAGTHSHGLLKIDLSGKVKSWNKNNSAISSDNIFSLHRAIDGLLWIGTWHGGLLSFDLETEEFKHYGRTEGLPSSTIFGILEDKQGYFWLSTYDGLVRFARCTTTEDCLPEIVVFNRHDGLQGNEFDADSHFQSAWGELFFAGMGGMNAFFPEDIPINTQAPSVKISRALLNGSLLPGSESEFVFPSIVDLPVDFGELRLEVSVLDFHNPIKNRLQYREVEDGGPWTDMQQSFLLIRGLSDGYHTFEFRGTNNDGFWSTQQAEIKFRVAPPLYRHPFMFALYALLLYFIPVIYFKGRQTQLMKKQHVLEERVKQRTSELELANAARERFFANVSHEICSPVHMILLMLENHMSVASTDDKALYRSATGYAAQLMVYLKQLVSEARAYEVDSRLYAVDPGKIIDNLVINNLPIARARSVTLNVFPLPENRVAFYSSSAISIFSNLLCNALVYTPEGGEIKISGEVKDEVYRLTIANTITTDQATDIKQFFDRGVRGAFNPNYFGGHGLGLSIVTSAVETLGGHIDVDFVASENTIVFNLDLPLADSSLPPLPLGLDMGFSYEQMLTIKLVANEDNEKPTPANNPWIQLNTTSVLIVEDDAVVAKLLYQALSQTYIVYTAGTCHDGVQLARKYQPDVILCDLYLPDEDGFEVLRAVRANRMTMDTFFVVVTASISEADRLKCQELGVDQFIRKPVSAENIKLLISNYLKLSVQRSERIQKEKLTRKAKIDTLQEKQPPFETRFADVLEELYQDPGTTIENIQTRLSLSYAALMSRCKETYGKSPKRLLIEKRIEIACKLLLDSDYKIGLISELAGFSTHSQFAIVFKKETGVTAAAFRRDNSAT